MKFNLKEALATPKGRLIVSLCALAACWLLILLWMAGDFILAVPSDARLASLENELRRQRNTYEKAAAEAEAAEAVKDRYRELIRHAWQNDRDGMVETALRQKILETARGIELKLNSLGAVRTSRINNELYYAEIDVMTSGTLDEIANFIAAIQGVEPQLAWRRMDIRPDNRAVRTSNNIVNLAELTEPEASRVNFNGALRVIGYDGPPLKTAAAKTQKPGERP